jgi:hypothetical protein
MQRTRPISFPSPRYSSRSTPPAPIVHPLKFRAINWHRFFLPPMAGPALTGIGLIWMGSIYLTNQIAASFGHPTPKDETVAVAAEGKMDMMGNENGDGSQMVESSAMPVEVPVEDVDPSNGTLMTETEIVRDETSNDVAVTDNENDRVDLAKKEEEEEEVTVVAVVAVGGIMQWCGWTHSMYVRLQAVIQWLWLYLQQLLVQPVISSSSSSTSSWWWSVGT